MTIEAMLLGMEWIQFISFLMFGYLGLVISYLIQLYKYYPRINKNGGFSIWFAISDNWIRIMIGLLIIPVGIRFSQELLGITITEWTAFLSGFFSDRTIDSLKNRKK